MRKTSRIRSTKDFLHIIFVFQTILYETSFHFKSYFRILESHPFDHPSCIIRFSGQLSWHPGLGNRSEELCRTIMYSSDGYCLMGVLQILQLHFLGLCIFCHHHGFSQLHAKIKKDQRHFARVFSHCGPALCMLNATLHTNESILVP